MLQPLWTNSRADWHFITIGDACKARREGCVWPRGKTLGGSSAINAHQYVRGHPHDYDHWSELGNPGWDYQSVLKYFKKFEGNQFQPFVDYANGTYHNANGPLKIDFSESLNPYMKLFYDAGIERGIPFIDDINADKTIGYFYLQGFYSKNRRQSTAKAYLIPARHRTNLHIIKHAFVEKILINDQNQAYGVKFTYNGKHKMEVFAKREVITSAGSIMSPVVLMLSGVGPKNHLKKYKIKTKADLAVGKNLYDHITAYLWFRFDRSEGTSPLAKFDDTYDFAIHNSGGWNSVGATELSAFINLDGKPSPAAGDVQLSFIYYPVNSIDGLKEYFKELGYRNDIQQELLKQNKHSDLGLVLIALMHPKSHGYIKLNGTSVCDRPRIYNNYFTHPDDMETMLRAIKQQLSFVTTKSYKTHGAKFINIPFKGCEQFTFESDDYFRCYIRYFTSTNFHPVGTCKMGPDSDPNAVVDARLRVRNVQKLRVIDASM